MGQIDFRQFFQKKIAIDSCIWIYLIENSDKNSYGADKFFYFQKNYQQKSITSVIAITEVLTIPRRYGNVALERDYIAMFVENDTVEVVDVNFQIAVSASELRAKYNIPTPDAIHLSTGIYSNADYFLTNDKDLKKVTEVEVVLLEEIKNFK